MTSFSRFHRLIGRQLILEAMSASQAQEIFKYHGIQPDEMLKPADLQAARNRLIRKYHPDRPGGNLEASQEVNAAYDVLKDTASSSKPTESPYKPYSPEQPKPRPAYTNDDDRDDSWAQAGWGQGMHNSSSISRHDYRDLNFIKKTMWLLSGKSRKPFTVLNFDGRYFRGQFTVYGSTEIYSEMVKAMIQWDADFNKRAIFIAQSNLYMSLVWLDGKMLPEPISFHKGEDYETSMPYNDQKFMRDLPLTLDRLSRGF